jgi:hypothetical protein
MEVEVNRRTTHYVLELDRIPLLNVSAIPLRLLVALLKKNSRQVRENITTAMVARFGFSQ